MKHAKYQINEFGAQRRRENFRGNLRTGILMIAISAVLSVVTMTKVVEILVQQ